MFLFLFFFRQSTNQTSPISHVLHRPPQSNLHQPHNPPWPRWLNLSPSLTFISKETQQKINSNPRTNSKQNHNHNPNYNQDPQQFHKRKNKSTNHKKSTKNIPVQQTPKPQKINQNLPVQQTHKSQIYIYIPVQQKLHHKRKTQPTQSTASYRHKHKSTAKSSPIPLWNQQPTPITCRNHREPKWVSRSTSTALLPNEYASATHIVTLLGLSRESDASKREHCERKETRDKKRK